MDRFIVVFCEGDHDIAFLKRLLLIDGFTPYTEKVKDFIAPLDQLYKNTLMDEKIEDTKFEYQRSRHKVPYTVFSKENSLVIFHNLSGDGNILKGQSTEITKNYLMLNDEAILEISGYGRLNYRFLYFLDADDEGVDFRLEEVRKLLGIDTSIEQYKIYKHHDYEIGCCIFYDSSSGSNKGKLENILLQIMEESNTEIFSNSKAFINDNPIETERQKRFICTDKEETYKNSTTFKREKSIISIAGQLQFSGSSNSVIIANSDYIRKEKLEKHPFTQSIIKLFY